MNQHAPTLETLENRLMLAAVPAPHVQSIVADNRGQVTVRFDRPVVPDTLNGRSVLMMVGKKRIGASLGWDAKTNRLFITATKSYPTKPYSIRLIGDRILGEDGTPLDGEFRSTRLKSGNGTPGGDYLVNLVAKTVPVARFSTIYGDMDVRLYNQAAPITYANFVSYANKGEWDGTFVHRSVQDDYKILQGGGYRIRNNQFQNITAQAPIKNESNPALPHLRGTIAMARTSALDSATSEWFFNNQTNSVFDPLKYAVFGKAANSASLKVMDKMGSLGIFDASAILGASLNELPVTDLAAVKKRSPASLLITDLVTINRVAMLMDVKAPAKAKVTAKSVAAEAAAKPFNIAAAGPVAQAAQPAAGVFNSVRAIGQDLGEDDSVLA